jgi:hypothetical protein
VPAALLRPDGHVVWVGEDQQDLLSQLPQVVRRCRQLSAQLWLERAGPISGRVRRGAVPYPASSKPPAKYADPSKINLIRR